MLIIFKPHFKLFLAKYMRALCALFASLVWHCGSIPSRGAPSSMRTRPTRWAFKVLMFIYYEAGVYRD